MGKSAREHVFEFRAHRPTARGHIFRFRVHELSVRSHVFDFDAHELTSRAHVFHFRYSGASFIKKIYRLMKKADAMSAFFIAIGRIRLVSQFDHLHCG